MKKLILTVLILTLVLTGCSKQPEKFQTTFSDAFDTITVVTLFCTSEKQFDNYVEIIHDEMMRLHRLFDIYNDYDGINNVKKINDFAGKEPVECAPEIIELLSEGVTAHKDTGGTVNVALGSVLRIWHDARDIASENPDQAKAPDYKDLLRAYEHTDIEKLIIDAENKTVYLEDPEMSLDVGAFAKGWAVERAVQLAREKGLKSGVISAGGNVAVVGIPLDGRDSWSIGIQSPDGNGLFDAVAGSDIAAVTSGDYERFFIADGVSYHHIINPETLFPADRYRSVTVLHEDSGIAEMLSTPIFILPEKEGEALAEKYSAEVLWIYADGTFKATDGYLARSLNLTS